MLHVNGTTEETKCEDLEKFTVDDDPKNFFQVGAQLPPQEKEELVDFLMRNVDVHLECLRSSRGGSELHLPSFEC